MLGAMKIRTDVLAHMYEANCDDLRINQSKFACFRNSLGHRRAV